MVTMSFESDVNIDIKKEVALVENEIPVSTLGY
jgi:hypothetical protein